MAFHIKAHGLTFGIGAVSAYTLHRAAFGEYVERALEALPQHRAYSLWAFLFVDKEPYAPCPPQHPDQIQIESLLEVALDRVVEQFNRPLHGRADVYLTAELEQDA